MEELAAIARALHTSGRRFVFACTAGLGGPSLLLATPGASASVLEATCPYSRRAFLDYTAPLAPPASFASPDAALCLARSSLRRARALALAEGGLGGGSDGGRLFGVGAAGALASAAPRRGEHRCHVALCSEAGEEVWTLLLDKDKRTRAQEDALCGAAVVGAAARAAEALPEGGLAGLLARCGLGGALGHPGDALSHAAAPCAPALQRLRQAAAGGGGGGGSSGGAPSLGAGEPVSHLLYTSPTHCHVNPRLADLPRPLVLLPGSFNPLHRGHLAMARAAVRALRPAAPPAPAPPPPFTPTLLFELSLENVDKAPLGEAQALQRLAAFFPPAPLPGSEAGASAGAGAVPLGGGGAAAAAAAAAASAAAAATAPEPLLAAAEAERHAGVLLTRAPRFIDKAALCGPGAVFVCGFDTAARLVMPVYYGGGAREMEGALGGLLAGGCRLVVGGRRAGAAPLPAGWPGAPPASADEFLTLSTHLLPCVPRHLWPLFVEIDQAEFHVDVSSREIRQAAAASGGAGLYA